jgi:membrane protease YdiL (CAAX protease family)
VKPYEALLCVAACLMGLLALGPIFVQHLGLLGILLSETALVGLPTVGFVQARGLPVIPSLGLAWPRLGPVVGGALAGFGGFWLVGLLEVGLERVLPVPADLKESLRQLVAGPQFILWDIIVLALSPAVCEEALFRGLAQPSLRSRLGAWPAIVITALLFAGFHLSLYRLVPTALLGVLLGILREKSGSLWPSMVFHALNNTLVLTLVRSGRDAPPLPTNVVGLAGLVAAVIALTLGLALVFRSPQRR